jgi:hypothetical protein
MPQLVCPDILKNTLCIFIHYPRPPLSVYGVVIVPWGDLGSNNYMYDSEKVKVCRGGKRIDDTTSAEKSTSFQTINLHNKRVTRS